MGKRFEISVSEQATVTNAIMSIAEILLLKMDNGTETPTIQGTINVGNENRKVTFSIKAESK